MELILLEIMVKIRLKSDNCRGDCDWDSGNDEYDNNNNNNRYNDNKNELCNNNMCAY